MAAYLTLITETDTESVPCGNGLTTIGRDRSNDIVLADLSVSRNHAIVRRLGAGDYYLVDSGSSNGSRVNQRRITSPTVLKTGDRISIGNVELTFEQEPEPESFIDSVSFEATTILHQPLIKEITILVADMRGFTSMSEQLPIQVLSRLMSQWFDRVSADIAEYGGTVDKFIGDCVFARWESDAPEEGVVDALQAVCRINDTTAEVSARFPELDRTVYIGAGIHTGTASLDIGNENTALGDSVNTAFRLEAAAKEIGADIVLSDGAFCHMEGKCGDVEWKELKLKGKAKPVKAVGLNFDRALELVKRLRKELAS